MARVTRLGWSNAGLALRGAIPLVGIPLVLVGSRLPHPALAIGALALEAVTPLLVSSRPRVSVAVAVAAAAFSTLALVVLNGGNNSPLWPLFLAVTVGSVLANALSGIAVSCVRLVVLLPVLAGSGPHALAHVLGTAAVCAMCVVVTRTNARTVGALEAQVETDSLTGIRNRLALDRHLERCLAAEGAAGGLIYVDLDGFRDVNRSRGHAAGDVLLKAVAAALTRVAPDAFVARAGGDEFILVVDARRDPLTVAQHILRVIANAGPPGLQLTATAGVACFPEDGTRPEELREAADRALRWGKVDGKARALRYDPRRTASAPDIGELEIRRLWLEDRISIYVQPIFDLRRGRVRGYEALARFNVEGESSPLRWFALADRVGLRPQLELACLKQSLRLFDGRPPGTFLSVNLSPDLLELSVVHSSLDAIPDLRGLVLELTEDAVIEDYDRLAQLLARHLERGLTIAVDDFGAGRANLRHAWSILPRYLKLDRTLVSNLDSDSARRALVGSIVAYAQDVGASLIAEGVETTAELDVVRELGVSFIQGFRLGKPAPPWPVIDLDALLFADGATSSRTRDPDLVVVRATDTARSVHQQFLWNPRASAAVLQDDVGRVVGLLTRNRLLVTLGVRFGFALNSERPVLEIADADFMSASPQMGRDEMIAWALARDESRRFDPVVLLDADGHLVGKLSLQELLEPGIGESVAETSNGSNATKGRRRDAVAAHDWP